MFDLYVDGGGDNNKCTYFYFSYRLFKVDQHFPDTTKKELVDILTVTRRDCLAIPQEEIPSGCSMAAGSHISSVNVAEYCALYYGLRDFKRAFGPVPVRVLQDSLIIVNQVNNEFTSRKVWLTRWRNAVQSIKWARCSLIWIDNKEIKKILGH